MYIHWLNISVAMKLRKANETVTQKLMGTFLLNIYSYGLQVKYNICANELICMNTINVPQ